MAFQNGPLQPFYASLIEVDRNRNVSVCLNKPLSYRNVRGYETGSYSPSCLPDLISDNKRVACHVYRATLAFIAEGRLYFLARAVKECVPATTESKCQTGCTSVSSSRLSPTLKPVCLMIPNCNSLVIHLCLEFVIELTDSAVVVMVRNRY